MSKDTENNSVTLTYCLFVLNTNCETEEEKKYL